MRLTTQAGKVQIDSWPPWKDIHQSIRNRKHKDHARFAILRRAATGAMAGRAWSQGPICLVLRVWGPALEPGRALLDYESGVMDTLDWSHSPSITYLPIAYEDDCQVTESDATFATALNVGYSVDLVFLADSTEFDYSA